MPGGLKLRPSARQTPNKTAKQIARVGSWASPLVLGALSYCLANAGLPAYALFFGYDQQAEAYKHQADYAYETQNYPNAINYYGQAINALPFDAYQGLAGMYYCRALANDVAGNYQAATGDWQQSKSNYDHLLQSAATSPQARINVAWVKSTSDELGRLVTWRQTCDPTTPDYFGNVPVRHWPASSFPLRIFVDESSGRGFGEGSRNTIMQALGQWVAANPSQLRITEVDDINQADIIYRRPLAGQVAQGSGGRTTYDSFADPKGNQTIRHSYVKLTCAAQDFNQMTEPGPARVGSRIRSRWPLTIRVGHHVLELSPASVKRARCGNNKKALSLGRYNLQVVQAIWW
jgi:tetratricopeptide (TPR) repeat protein